MDIIIIPEQDDSRLGSARDGSEGGTLSAVSGNNSASLSSLFATFVPILIYTVVCLSIFSVFRTRLLRVYSPRAILRNLLPEAPSPFNERRDKQRSTLLPKGWFDWVLPFWRESDVTVLNRSSIDAYLFLRYLKLLSFICFVGCCIIWPVLMPIHATGSGGLTRLDSATIGNVTDPNFFFAHVAVAWVFFGFVLFAIYRESIFYINLRHAYLLHPYYANRLSSRTVLFQCVPDRYLDARRLRQVFGESDVANVWIPRDTSELARLVDERDKTAVRLENTEIRLIKLADKARRRGQRAAPRLPEQLLPPPDSRHYPAPEPSSPHASSSSPSPSSTLSPSPSSSSSSSRGHDVDADADPEKNPALPDVNGSVAAQWLPASHRPAHRPLGNFLRRVDTIKWTRQRLKALHPRIYKLRRMFRSEHIDSKDAKPLGSVFIEFTTQSAAQRALQTLSHDKPLHMAPRLIGIPPDEVVWLSLRMGWFERMLRKFAVRALVMVAILFWSVPAAAVGIVSNIRNLSEMFVFLRWLQLLPAPILGFLQGFLPPLALSLLMAIVPGLMRGCARLAGELSLGEIELFVQNAYFGFQVVQVFLITTLTSAASAAFTDVLRDPLSARELLSENLPKASNFYLSYILIQCLAVGATTLLRLWDLIRHGIVVRFFQRPRAVWRIWKGVRPVHWGGWFPVFTNMGVIVLSYCCIAPIILGFAAAGMYVMYLVNKYNMLLVDDSSIDTRGLVYPRALRQLLIGLYLAEICIIGLFTLRLALIPMALMIILLVFTVLFHFSLRDALSPLLQNLPLTLALENEELMAKTAAGKKDDDLSDAKDGDEGNKAQKQQTNGDPPLTGTNNEPAASVPLPHAYLDDDHDDEEEGYFSDDDEHDMVHETTGSRTHPGAAPRANPGLEGGPALARVAARASWAFYVGKFTSALHWIGLGPVLSFLDGVIRPTYRPDPHPILRFLHPCTFDSFEHIRATWVPHDLPDPRASYPADYGARAYHPPEVWSPAPRIWIPRDDGGVSAQEVLHCKRYAKVVASDEGAWLDEKGTVVCEVEKAPFWEVEEQVLY
ncbi:phosphate metabolism protein [Sodiomyces alkalinus F11]|uniref:Phosphate metabolism protein n=1 Tax=Sodiomyces alkalinus (strain CBS 110278 / VKM F-3762 / F11) TaxID=1314773 RepID=A0A3N2Q7D3_SODAK|nr:phosphate metabolism protein [Sodiomyces alkalinus F11]ROT42626.1 phosphate metabolism protein [Sodiomyces alkalinus F11]